MPFRTVISFFVPGLPRPGGSKTATVIRRKDGSFVMNGNRPVITMRDDAKGNGDWKANVKFFAGQAFEGDPLLGQLRVTFAFVLPRRKGDYRSTGQLKASAPTFHSVKPDLTKLIRSTEDACTGVVWHDDATIVMFGEGTAKRYGEKPGVQITVEVLEAGSAPAAEKSESPALFA